MRRDCQIGLGQTAMAAAVVFAACATVTVFGATQDAPSQISVAVAGRQQPEIGLLGRALKNALETQGSRVTLNDVQSAVDGAAFVTRKETAGVARVLILDDADVAALSLRGNEALRLTPIALVASSPWAVLVRRDEPIEPLAMLRSKPLNYGVGPGAPVQLFSRELPIKGQADVRVYKSNEEWDVALKMGVPQVTGAPLAAAFNRSVLNEKYRPVAIAATDRLTDFAQLPVLSEEGVRRSYASVYAVMASGDMTVDVVATLSQSFVAAVRDTLKYRQEIGKSGFTVLATGAAESRHILLVRTERYAAAIESVNPFAGAITTVRRGQDVFVQFRLAVRALVRVLIYRISSFDPARERKLGNLVPTTSPHEFNVTREAGAAGAYHVVVYARSETGSVDFPQGVDVEVK